MKRAFVGLLIHWHNYKANFYLKRSYKNSKENDRLQLMKLTNYHHKKYLKLL